MTATRRDTGLTSDVSSGEPPPADRSSSSTIEFAAPANNGAGPSTPTGFPSTPTTASPTAAATPAARSGDRALGSDESPGRIRRIRQVPSGSGDRSAPSNPCAVPGPGGVGCDIT